MSIEDHPRSLNSEQHHAFSERVAWHTISIINRVRRYGRSPAGDSVSEDTVGMGSAVLWNGKRMILTAKHVLEDATPEDLEFFTRCSGPIDWGTRPADPQRSEAMKLQIDRIVSCQSEDLACIVLRPESPNGQLEFLDLPSGFAAVPPKGGGTLIYGCPVDQNVPVGAWRHGGGPLLVALAARPRGCWAQVVAEVPQYFPSWFDSGRHFLLKYDPSLEGSQARGFSGSGVWYRNVKNDSLWFANPVVAGVETHWHRESNLMIAVRSEVVQRFMEEAVG